MFEQDCGKNFSRPHHLKRHIGNVHRPDKSRSGHATFDVEKDISGDGGRNQNDNQVFAPKICGQKRHSLSFLDDVDVVGSIPPTAIFFVLLIISCRQILMKS